MEPSGRLCDAAWVTVLPLLVFACRTPTPAPQPFDIDDLAFVEPADLPASADPPELLVRWSDGVEDATVAEWEEGRRCELVWLFEHYVYGRMPAAIPAVETGRESFEAFEGRATLEVVRAEVAGVPFTMAVFWPAVQGPVPVVFGIDKCGLDSIAIHPDLPAPTGFVEDSCPAEAGGRASHWDIEQAIDAGVAVATVHQSDFAPDDPAGVSALREAVDPASDATSWATIGVWAYGTQRAVDLLDADARTASITVFGHSRRGKTALWATALDDRIDAVWAHQSGTGGATLSRSYDGEPLGAMVQLFPHWFPDSLAAFAGREEHLPLDQHALIALAAPRPVMIRDGDDDLWADPEGATRAVQLSLPAFGLYAVEGPVRTMRPGGHDVRSEDWTALLAFIDGW